MPRPPAPRRSLAPGLPLSRRPAPRRLVGVIALAVILIAAAPAVSAETIIIDTTIADYVDTSVSASETISMGATSTVTRNSVFFKQIELYNDVKYIVIEIPGNVAPEGSRYVSYSLATSPTQIHMSDTAVIYAVHHTNALGAVTKTRLTIFPQNWEIGTLSGQKYIIFNESLYSAANSGFTTGSLPTPVGVGYGDKWMMVSKNPCTIYLTALNSWSNDLIVSTDDMSYNINLYRHYPSEIIIYNGDTEVYKNYGNNDKFLTYPKVAIDAISIKSPAGKTYNYTLTDQSSTSEVIIYVRNSQTGALLANAHLTISDAVGDPPELFEVVNATLPGGTGTFNLEKADYLKYHASATADGYTLLSPIIFGVPEGGTTIALWMSPDAAPDVPTEEGKSPLYGYTITQGSQQPIPGAIVSLDGYGSTTTSSTGFYLFNNITPGGPYTLSASAPLHDALSEPVAVDSAPTQHNLALTGHYLLTVTIKDGDDLTNLHNTTISLSDGQESTQNPATFTADYGPYTITAAAGGYYPQIQSAYLDKPGTTTATVLLTAKPEPVPPPEMPNYPPHNVKFTIQTLLGTPISGVSVTAQGIQQTPSTNILERLLGLNMTSTPITTELMSGTTDTNGEINFMMVEAVKYQISIYKPDVVNQTLEIYPKEDTYPIIISTAGGPLLPDAGDALRDIRINVTTSTEGDTGHIHIDYNDTTRKTTGLTIQVTQQNTTNTSAPEDVIASHTVANDANVTHTFDLSVYKGQSFFVRLEAEHPDFGTVHRDYAVAFKGVRVPLGPLPDGLYIYVAGFGLMLLGGIFGATSATRGVVVIAFAGWLFYAFGWLDDLGLIAPVSLGLVSTIAVMGVIVTRYKEEGYT